VVVGKEAGTFDALDLRLLEVLGGYATLVLGRLEREERLVQAREEAEEAAQLKSAMLANMSHEVRTPLMSMIGSAPGGGGPGGGARRHGRANLPEWAAPAGNARLGA
jgi:signal transduction histidine kinase